MLEVKGQHLKTSIDLILEVYSLMENPLSGLAAMISDEKERNYGGGNMVVVVIVVMREREDERVTLVLDCGGVKKWKRECVGVCSCLLTCFSLIYD